MNNALWKLKSVGGDVGGARGGDAVRPKMPVIVSSKLNFTSNENA